MKGYEVELMPSARLGLLDIGEYIALDNPDQAMSFIDELTGALKKTLSIFPYSGTVVEDLDIDEEIRFFPHGNYNSYYRVIEERQLVEVLFIFNTNRDIRSLIKDL